MWEKAGVGVSVVYGTMPPEAYRAATGTNRVRTNGGGNGVHSSPLHPTPADVHGHDAPCCKGNCSLGSCAAAEVACC